MGMSAEGYDAALQRDAARRAAKRAMPANLKRAKRQTGKRVMARITGTVLAEPDNLRRLELCKADIKHAAISAFMSNPVGFDLEACIRQLESDALRKAEIEQVLTNQVGTSKAIGALLDVMECDPCVSQLARLLADRCKDSAFAKVAKLAIDILDGVDHADMSPENAALVRDNAAKLEAAGINPNATAPVHPSAWQRQANAIEERRCRDYADPATNDRNEVATAALAENEGQSAQKGIRRYG